MFLTKEEAIKRGASEEFINAKPILCDTCLCIIKKEREEK